MIDVRHVTEVVSAVCDPELGPVTIADLGLLRSVTVSGPADEVRVVLTPTFLGCPAVSIIAAAVRAAARRAGAATVEVVWDPAPWSETQVTAEGRRKLAALGIAVGHDSSCPRCQSPLSMVSASSAASCRSMARCTGCGDVVDVLRGAASPIRWSHYVYL